MGDKAKSKAKAENRETIKIKNRYFEERVLGPMRQDGSQLVSRNFQSLMDKKIFPHEYKPNWWVGRAFDKIVQEMKAYIKARQDLIRQYAKKHEKDGKETDENGKIIKEWKKGDPMSFADGTPVWEDYDAFVKDLEELQEIEIDLGIWKIEFDPEKGPDSTPGEDQILIPLLKEPQEGKEKDQ